MGKFTKCYDSQESKKKYVKDEIILQYANAVNCEDNEKRNEAARIAGSKAYAVNFIFYMPICKSDNKKTKKDKEENIEYCTSKPDLDNLEKFYLDCLSDIIYPDDRMVVVLSSSKKYSITPRVEIEVIGKF